MYPFVNQRCSEVCLSMANEQPFWGQITKDVPQEYRYQDGALVSSLPLKFKRSSFKRKGWTKGGWYVWWDGVVFLAVCQHVEGKGKDGSLLPHHQLCVYSLSSTQQTKQGTKYRYADDSYLSSHPLCLFFGIQLHRKLIWLLKPIRCTPFDHWPLGLDMKRSVFHQNTKCGQGDMTYKKQSQDHAHTHTFPLLSTSEIKRPKWMRYRYSTWLECK